MEDNTYIKNKFNDSFPNILFESLIKQRYDLKSRDGYIHFIHNKTNEIYSWNDFNKEWLQYNDLQQKALLYLFNIDDTK